MTKLISPAPNGMPGLEFGSAKSPYSWFRRHKGKDWKWLYANEVASKVTVAPADGTVVEAFNDGGYHNDWGNYVDIQVSRSVIVRLAHHATGSVRVRKGDRVTAGDRIGTMGSTGKANGDHLHEGLMIDGKWVDPDLYRGVNGKHLPGTPVPAGDLVAYKHTQVVLADLNLRKSPKTGDVITTIPKGTVVKTGRTVAGWTPVKYGTRTGWCAGEFLVHRTRRVRHLAITLRDKPRSLKKSKVNPSPARRVARLPIGTKVTVLEVHGKTDTAPYWKVRAGSKVGWVVGKYVK